jgi:protein TonB
MRRRDLGRYSAIIGSVALHAGLLAAVLIVLPKAIKPLHVSDITPVTLMTSADLTNMRAAIAAPAPTPAQTETPAPEAPPVQPAPQEAPQPPQPAPPPPKPAPAPKPAPVPPPKAAPAQPPPKPAAKTAPSDDSFLADLDASLARTAKTAGAKRAAAARGATRAETAVVARTGAGAGTAVSASALSSMAAELQRLWNPNCEVAGGADVDIKVSFRLGPAGRLIGQPESSAENAADPVVKAASDRAVRAVNQAQPFADLPSELYGPKIAVNFNARQACAQR